MLFYLRFIAKFFGIKFFQFLPIVIVIVIVLVASQNIVAQQKYSISGVVQDSINGEELIGASITIKEANTGVATNEYGFFSITLPQGTYTLIISYLGYKEYFQKIDLNANYKLNIDLASESTQLKEVVVNSEKVDKNVREVQMSVAQIDIKQIRKIPALLGEVDVVRSVQLLPGVSTVGEGATGFNVRGGNIDQNLILIDEAPVYNSAHLFGFFSVFNPDAVKDVKLIKGGIPANYGGRLSSILDVRLKDGNSKKFSVKGGLGLIFSRLALEGPINKGKGSYVIAGRRSYVDVVGRPFLTGAFEGLKAYFYDVTAKVNYSLGSKDKIYLSGYLGRDVFGSGFQFNWGSANTSFRWNHIFNNKLFMNVTSFYSNYDYRLGTINTTTGGDGFEWKSNIINTSIKPDFTWYINPKNTVTFGFQSLYYNFKPGTAKVTVQNQSSNIVLPDKYGLENALYAANEQTINDKISIQYGLRFSTFSFLGPSKSYQFRDNEVGDRKTLLNVTNYRSGENIKTYHNFEPRFSAKYQLNETSAIKTSYNRTVQYIHLVSNTAASVPLDVWTPSTNNIKPQYADQAALGYFRNFGQNNDYETSIEGYYKKMGNQLEYVDEADLLLNEFLEGDLLSGKGRAYGLELYLKKNTGRFTGWISYTLSKTERQTNGVNRDEWYNSRFDRPHNLNIVASYDLTERLSVSANVVFASGTPITLQSNKYIYEGMPVAHDPSMRRNNYRIPNTYRLDLSATYKCKKIEGRKYTWDVVFAVYNATNRRNPFSIFRKATDPDFNFVGPDEKNIRIPNQTANIRYSIIGSIIPAITYNFSF